MLEDDDTLKALEDAEERYSFDSAKLVPCGNGCGAAVRMFPGGQWWIDPRNPPPMDPWWCPGCLHDKILQALEDAGVSCPTL